MATTEPVALLTSQAVMAWAIAVGLPLAGAMWALVVLGFRLGRAATKIEMKLEEYGPRVQKLEQSREEHVDEHREIDVRFTKLEGERPTPITPEPQIPPRRSPVGGGGPGRY